MLLWSRMAILPARLWSIPPIKVKQNIGQGFYSLVSFYAIAFFFASFLADIGHLQHGNWVFVLKLKHSVQAPFYSSKQNHSWIVSNKSFIVSFCVIGILPDWIHSLGNRQIRLQGFWGKSGLCGFLQYKDSELSPLLMPPSSLARDSTTLCQ